MSSKLDGRRSLTAEAAEAPVMASAAVKNWGIRTMVAVVLVVVSGRVFKRWGVSLIGIDGHSRMTFGP